MWQRISLVASFRHGGGGGGRGRRPPSMPMPSSGVTYRCMSREVSCRVPARPLSTRCTVIRRTTSCRSTLSLTLRNAVPSPGMSPATGTLSMICRCWSRRSPPIMIVSPSLMPTTVLACPPRHHGECRGCPSLERRRVAHRRIVGHHIRHFRLQPQCDLAVLPMVGATFSVTPALIDCSV